MLETDRNGISGFGRNRNPTESHKLTFGRNRNRSRKFNYTFGRNRSRNRKI